MTKVQSKTTLEGLLQSNKWYKQIRKCICWIKDLTGPKKSSYYYQYSLVQYSVVYVDTLLFSFEGMPEWVCLIHLCCGTESCRKMGMLRNNGVSLQLREGETVKQNWRLQVTKISQRTKFCICQWRMKNTRDFKI